MRIETQRLLLRPMGLGDLDEFVALHADPEVSRFIRSLDKAAAKERLDRDEREWLERGHGMLAMLDLKNGAFLGRCGLKYWPQFDETELGWALRRDTWGQGYATEAGRACIEWGFAGFDLSYLTAMVNAGNARSIRVAERLGLSPLRNDVLLGDPVVVYGLRRDEPIRLAPYNPSWPDRFAQEKAALYEAIGSWATGGIHHVGSTGVPGLDAKPIIDILVGVDSLEASRACLDPLAKLGYLYAPYRADEMHWFCKPHPSRRTHHLHLVPTDSRRFCDELAFRDRLRASSETAEEYATLKRELAERFGDNREAYTDAKSEFIRRVIDADST